MNKTDLKWGTQSPIELQDWKHVEVDKITGVEKPLKIAITSYGVYSFEVTNEEVFEKINAERQSDSSSEYMWINHILMNTYSTYIINKGKDKVLYDIAGNINHSKELLEYVNENTNRLYGDMGFKFTDIKVYDLSLTEESEKKVKEFEKEHLKNDVSMDQEKQIEGSTSKNVEASESNNNVIPIVGIVLAIIVIVSIASVILIHKFRK